MTTGFQSLGVSPPIVQAVEELGFTTPTEVQRQAIPHILSGRDTIIRSKTGSGKTAVFAVSILQLIRPQEKGPQALILAPTRELAVQVDKDVQQISKYLPHRTTAVYGQHNMNTEIKALQNGVSIVTGTPGRVYDHIRHRKLLTKNIRFLVLDEADRMLDMGFIDEVSRIIKTLPRNRVTLVSSATVPDEIRRLCSKYMKNPITVDIESPIMTVETVQQEYYRVDEREKRFQLNRLLQVEQPESCMIFCNTKATVNRLQSYLAQKGYASKALHGDISQGTRMNTMKQFEQGKFHILVATDVAARGIHIDGLSLVINYDVPLEKDGYVHRIGRTARSGHGGRAFTLVTGEDIISLYEIEEHIGTLIPEAELPTESMVSERLASAKSWMKTKSVQSTVTEPLSKRPPKRTKKQSAKSAQSSKRPRRRPQKRDGQRPAKERDLAQSAAQTKPAGKADEASTVAPAPKPAAATTVTSTTPAARPGSSSAPDSHRRPNTTTVAENTPSNPPSPKEPAPKSFLKRLLGRVFNR